jgi:hypothetical protein
MKMKALVIEGLLFSILGYAFPWNVPVRCRFVFGGAVNKARSSGTASSTAAVWRQRAPERSEGRRDAVILLGDAKRSGAA